MVYSPVTKELTCCRGYVNSGPPSVAHSPGIPKVVKVCRRLLISPYEPSCARSIIGQFEQRSTTTR